jgi:Carboxypeptidase regulatory-like domain
MRFGRYAALLAILACLPAVADPQYRSLTGIVVDNRGNSLPDAAVQIENENTLEVRSYITDRSGLYRFNELSTDADYTVRAKYHEVWSRPKTLSKFDSDAHPQIKLVIPVE